jgi:hypothetical protein
MEEMNVSVLRVGYGRGFVVEQRVRQHTDRIVITAAHCIDQARLLNDDAGLPSCHPWRSLAEATYPDLLGSLEASPTIWAQCLYVEPIADLAVLGAPDSQEFCAQAEAYEQLVESVPAFSVAEAPAQGIERLTPGEGPAWVLSLDGHWREGRVAHRGGVLAFAPKELIVSGMSGSPIVNANGAAIGVVSTESMCPVILQCLSIRLARSIAGRTVRNPARRKTK